MPTPRPADLFDGTPSEQVQQFEALKSVIADSIAEHDENVRRGGVNFVPKQGVVRTGASAIVAEMQKAGLTADVIKEWELGNPIPQTPVQYTGITPYNVEQAVLMIVPKELKLRNSTARVKGIGQGLEYRRITGVSNSTYANRQGPFFSSVANTQTFNGVTLNRPNLISYTGDTYFKPFVEMGFSDYVSTQQQFAAQGFTDARALSSLSLIWAHVLGEERALLNSRSTALSVSGHSISSAAQSTEVTSGSGLPAISASTPVGDVYVTFSSSYGESQALYSAGAVSISAGYGVDVTLNEAPPAGTLAVNVYVVSTGPVYWKGTTVLAETDVVSPATFATVTALPSHTADNGSYPNYLFGGTLATGATSNSIFAYDGAVTEFSNASLAGYVEALNAPLSSASPGVEFQTALSTLYVQQGADPDVIWTTGSIMQTLFTNLQNAPSSNAYRVNLIAGDNGVTVGGAVTGIVNPSTSKVVDISTHRYMPPGVAVIAQLQVPWPDSNVTACMKVANVVDTMIIDWPQIGMSYDQSTYTYGTCVFEAPILSGTIININD